jgi:hypothetical protein
MLTRTREHAEAQALAADARLRSGAVALMLYLAWPTVSHLGGLVSLVAAVLLAMLVYAAALWIVGVDEVRGITTYVGTRLRARAAA